MTHLHEHSATELAELIRTRQASSREVVQAHLDRIEAVNGRINALTVILAESALEAADRADAALAAAGAGAGADAAELGPLHGVPFTIKENVDCVGSPTTQGVPAFAEALPPQDAPVVERMKAAGAIPLARSNMPEFGLRLSTDNPLRGRTLNPWHPELTAGGSSGGEAAALATGMTPIGLGNDIGGSLRNPSYCCGTAALKPTQGRIPHASSLEPFDAGMAVQAMLCEGPMARTVADLRLGLSILAGRDIRDPRSVDAPLVGPPLGRGGGRRPRAALVTRIEGASNIPPATIAAIVRAGEQLAAAGWEVEEAEPPELERVSEIWGNVLTTDFADLVPLIQPIITKELFEGLSQLNAEYGPKVSNSVLHAERSRLVRAWSAFFADYPVVVGPTWTRSPWRYDADLDPETGLETLRDTIRFITPGNVLGLPSVVVPTGVADGLPVGVQVYADLWREDLCLEAAEVVEAGVERATPAEPVA